MKRYRSFEENPIHNFEIQEEFEKLMQIEGLRQSRGPAQELFPSLKTLFRPRATTSIIGKGPNANLRAFDYLLLCHIRKVHLKQLVAERQQNEADQLTRQQGLRDRRVSFNGKGAVFLNGPQYENYALHKLRIYAFSSGTNLALIRHSPFEWDPAFQFNQQPLSSQQLKKMLSEFLKQLLPTQLPRDYKTSLKSVKWHLNEHHLAGMILSMVMRHVLHASYEIDSALDFQEEVGDHTVCTSLCDAFAIDGLKCKDNFYEINTWCRVHSVASKQGRLLFVEILYDQFEEQGLRNDPRAAEAAKPVAKPRSIDTFNQGSEQGEGEARELPPLLGVDTAQSFRGSEMLQSEQYRSSVTSGSMMDNDEDSQIASNGEESGSSSYQSSKIGSSQGSAGLKQNSYSGDRHSATGAGEDGFRSTFNNFTKNHILNRLMEAEEEGVEVKEEEGEEGVEGEKGGHRQTETSIKAQQEGNLQGNLLPATGPFKKKSFHNGQPEDLQPLCFSKPSIVPHFGSQSTAKPCERPSPLLSAAEEGPSSVSPPAARISLSKPRVKTGKSGQEQGNGLSSPGIVNNNISNNIYLSLGGTDLPVINISTGRQDPRGININIV